jgi:chromosome segregation protein
MRLKEIRLSGFKSFPKKTLFDLKEGITSFVGPNGCGKSNIIDAIKWTLGEMSAKSLRAEGMEDLIFTGTETRPPVGMAEVVLTFENNGGIPTDFDEVEIKRRFFRSGEGEFLINDTPCRLRDIQDLFANTGLKSAILNQGLVEDFLISDSELRREIFESISGIKRYRGDRKEAQNKLNSVSNSLEKIELILNEKRSVARSLKNEANRAKRYHKFKEELKEKSILVAKYQLFEIENTLKEKENIIGKQNKKINDTQSIINKWESEIKIGEEDLKEKREEYRKRGNEIQERQEKTSALRERKAGNTGELKHIDNFTKDLPKDIPAIIKELQKEMDDIEGTEEKLNAQIQKHKKKIEEIEKEDSLVSSKIETLKEKDLSLTVKKEEQNQRIIFLKESQKNYKKEIDKENIKIKELNSTIVEIEEKLKENTKIINALAKSIEKSENEKAATLRKLTSMISENEKIKKEIEFYKNKDIEISKEMKKINEKFSLPSLSDNLKVKKGYEAAIEAIFGERVKSAVGKSGEIKEVLDFIKKESLKGGIFAIKGKEEAVKESGLAGVVSGKFSHLLKKELSKYNFAETLEEALKKAKEKGVCWVTKNGDILMDNFIVLSKNKEGVLIRRAKEKELTLKEKECQTQINKLEEKRNTIINVLNDLEIKLKKGNSEREEITSEKAKLEFEISRVELRIESINNNINDAKKEIQNINKAIKEEDKEKEDVKKSLSLDYKKQEEIKEKKEEAGKELAKVEKKKEKITDRESQTRVEIGRLKEGLRLIQRKAILEKEIKELDINIKKETKKYEELKEENSSLNDKIQKAEEILEGKKAEYASIQEEKNNMEKEVSELKMTVSEEKYKKDSIQSGTFKEFGVEIKGEKVEIEEDIDEHIEKLRRKIDALYPINPLALNQYEERQAELDKIETERSDLISSKKDIEETIEEIDTKATREFKETILSIKEDFKSIYSKLSPGGTADIRLPSTNILESDIEILVRPKGKRLKRMELFSTGEKTLAAVALLLSIMRKKQSPIYIMDEIDAPLDENNIERFNDILREFSETSQIIIVTHNRATMERSDFIYGITMEENGVSTALSINVNEI